MTHCRALAEQHAAAAAALRSAADGERRTLTASEARTHAAHYSEARALREAAEQYGRRRANVDRLAAELGQTGPRRSGTGYQLGGGQTYQRGDHRGHSWVRDLVSANHPDVLTARGVNRTRRGLFAGTPAPRRDGRRARPVLSPGGPVVRDASADRAAVMEPAGHRAPSREGGSRLGR